MRLTLPWDTRDFSSMGTLVPPRACASESFWSRFLHIGLSVAYRWDWESGRKFSPNFHRHPERSAWLFFAQWISVGITEYNFSARSAAPAAASLVLDASLSRKDLDNTKLSHLRMATKLHPVIPRGV